ncbi:10664_t:CDS:2 [Funneliformis caledonium]|uniref:10664_t:CDS:1 n=1 Tax=Funneliformis caledonium TaxID=1117310 RepID=A0A9N9E909_9GLOM|nr:10664_t:CDS:2 [Funneliformis caledonium]
MSKTINLSQWVELHFELDKSGDRSYVANTNFQGNCCIENRRTTPSVIGTSRLDRTIACLPRRWFYTRNKRDSSSKCCLNAKKYSSKSDSRARLLRSRPKCLIPNSKETYVASDTSVQLGWLIDPIN